MSHLDKAPAQRSLVSIAAVRNCRFERVDHPPDSLDLIRYDYHLFPNIKKNHLAEKKYHTNDDLSAVDDVFDRMKVLSPMRIV